jgi:hypothetical protein
VRRASGARFRTPGFHGPAVLRGRQTLIDTGLYPLEELYGLWRRAAKHSRAAIAKAFADGGLDQPAKYTTSDGGTSPNLRRIVVDLHDEYARHVGHADLLREAVDGLVGEDPPQ